MVRIIIFLTGISSIFAAPEIPFGTTANGGFDINSISSFLDEENPSKFQFPSESGKGFSYSNYPASSPGSPYKPSNYLASSPGSPYKPNNYPASSPGSPYKPSNYPASSPGSPYKASNPGSSYPASSPGSLFKPQTPSYPNYFTSAPTYSLKPGPAPTPQPTEPPTPPPSYATPSPYQPATKGYALGDSSVNAANPGQTYFPGPVSPEQQVKYRPPNKNYVLGDPSQKNTNVFGNFGSTGHGSILTSTHGSYRPPNKNYVLGDPSLTKGSNQGIGHFFPKSQSTIAAPQISNFVVGSQSHAPSFGNHHTAVVGSSTPSYQSPSGFGSQQGNFNNAFKPTGGGGLTSPGAVGIPQNNPTAQVQTHLANANGQVNGFRYPTNPSNGFGVSGSGGQINYLNQPHINGAGQPGKFVNPVNFIPPNQNQHLGPVHNPGQFAGNNFGFSTNYIVPSNNYGNQPGHYPPNGLYQENYGGINQQGIHGQTGVQFPVGVTPVVNRYPAHLKGVNSFKGHGGFDPTRYRRVPPKYTGPYRGPVPVTQASSYKKPPYVVPPPASIFEDMMFL